MGGLIRPVGPESAETYWKRRALVVGAMLVVLIVLLVVWINLVADPGRAAPAGSNRAIGNGPTAAATTPAAEPSARTAPAGPLSSPTAVKPTAVKPTAVEPTAGKPTAGKPTAGKPTACRPKDLRVTLRGGHRRVAVGSTVRFELSVINGSSTSCRVVINRRDFELRITSGTDRIWSSDDCARLVPGIGKVVGPEKDVAWTMTWNGRRSRPGGSCATRPQTPGAGYYYATARLGGADPVRFLMVLH